jgi:hypothetical protein
MAPALQINRGEATGDVTRARYWRVNMQAEKEAANPALNRERDEILQRPEDWLEHRCWRSTLRGSRYWSFS